MVVWLEVFISRMIRCNNDSHSWSKPYSGCWFILWKNVWTRGESSPDVGWYLNTLADGTLTDPMYFNHLFGYWFSSSLGLELFLSWHPREYYQLSLGRHTFFPAATLNFQFFYSLEFGGFESSIFALPLIISRLVNIMLATDIRNFLAWINFF